MPVYVDHLRAVDGDWLCHLYGDSRIELAEVAKAIGATTPKKWATKRQHFILNAAQRARAIELGAQVISGRERR